jgi:hypothetical protein
MSPPSKTKKRSKRVQTKFCKTCGQDILENERRDMFMFHDTYHQLQTKDYCKDHEAIYSDHKCKPCLSVVIVGTYQSMKFHFTSFIPLAMIYSNFIL